MASKQFEFILNFATQFDKSKLSDIVAQINKLTQQSKFEIGFDQKSTLKEFENLKKIIDQINANSKGMDLNIDASKALKGFNQISVEMQKILGSDIGKAFDNIDLTELDKAMNDIEKSVSNIDLTELEKAMGHLAIPETAFDGLEKGITGAKKNVKDLEANLTKMTAEGKKGTPEFIKIEQELKLANLEATKMESALKSVSNEAKNASSFTDKMAKFGLAQQGITAIANGVSELAQPFIALDTATQKIKTLGGDAKALAPAFREMSLEMSNSLGASATDIQGATYEALSAGIKATKEDIGAFMSTATKLAIGGGETIGNTVNVLSSNINAYGLAATDASKVSDILFNTANFGKTSITELSSGLANVVPTASAAGISLANVGASLAVMTSKGIPTVQSTTKLNALLVELQKPGATLAPILAKAGVSLASLKNEGLPANLGRISEALKKAGTTATQAFSSTEASAAFNTLGGDIVGFTDALDKVANTTNSTNDAFAEMSDGIETKVSAIKNKVDNLIVGGMGALGNSFVTVTSASAKLAPTVTTMVGLGQALPIEKMKSLGVSALASAKSLGSMNMAGLFKGAGTAISGLGPSLAKLGPMLANPWVLAGVGLTLFLTSTKKGKETLAKLGDVGTELLAKFKPFTDFLGVVLFGVIDGLGEVISGLGDSIGAVAEAFFSIVTAITDLLHITGGVTDANGNMGSSFEIVTSIIKDYFAILKLVPLGISLIADAISGLAQNAPELIGAFVDYLKAKLNPASWFGEDTDAEKKASAKLGEVLDKVGAKARERIGGFQLGKELDNALDSKKKLDKSAELEKLAKDFAKTTDEIKKGDIASKIAEMAPDAVAGYKQIINAQGEVVQVADINIKKLNELTEAQKKSATTDLSKNADAYTNSLKVQANQYDVMKEKSSSLAQKIVDDSKKGIDTRSSRLEYEKLQTELAGKTKTINKTLNDASKVGITVAGDVKFPPSFQEGFADQLSKVVKSPEIAKAGASINDIIKLKGNIDGEGSLKELVKKFNEAKTDIDKENIAKVIAKSVPNAVKAVGTVVDENGKLITQYSVASEEVKKYAKTVEKETNEKILAKSKEVQTSILAEADSYDQLKVLLQSKQKEINEAKSKGIDTTELQGQYDAISIKIGASGEALIKTTVEAKRAGIDSEEIYNKLAKELGKSPAEVKKMVIAQEDSIEKAKKQKATVSELAKEWDAAKSGVDGLVKSQVSALADINKQLGDKKLTAEKRAELALLKADTIKAGKEAVTQQKNMAKAELDAGTSIGLNAKTVMESVKTEFELKKGKLELDKQVLENIQAQNLLIEGRVKNTSDELVSANQSVNTAEKERDVYIDILKRKRLISEVDSNGEIKFLGKLTPPEKAEVAKTLQDLNKSLIDNRSKVQDIQLKVKADSKEIKKMQDEISDLKFQAEMELGIRTKEDIFQKTKARLQESGIEIQKELDEINSKLSIKQLEQQKKLASINVEQLKQVSKSILESKKEEISKTISGMESLSKLYAEQNEKLAKITEISDEKKRKTQFASSEKSFNSQISKAKKDVAEFSLVFTKIQEELKANNIEISDTGYNTIVDKYQKQFESAEINNSKILGLESDRKEAIAKLCKKGTTEEKQSINEKYNNQIKELTNFNVDFGKLQGDLGTELSKYFESLPESQRKLIEATGNSNLKELIKGGIEQEKLLIANQKDIRDRTKAEYDRQITDIKDVESAKLTAMQSSYDKQANALNQFLEIFNKANIDALNKEKDRRANIVDNSLETEKKKLDKYKAIGTISEEEYQNRLAEITQNSANNKADIEEKIRKKAQLLENLAKGQLIDNERENEARKAKIQKDSAEEQLAVFKAKFIKDGENFDELKGLQSDFNRANEEYLKDSLNVTKQLNKKDAEETLKKSKLYTGLGEAERKALETSVNSLDTSKKILDEKGSVLNEAVGVLSTGVGDAIANLFAGNSDGIVESARKTFQVIAGIIQKEITAFVLRLVLSEGTLKYLAALPFPLNILSVPVITATITGGVKAITDPLMSSITSFASGGRIDKPTLAVVGDGARLGSQNREWIFNDPQLQATVNMAVNGHNDKLLTEIKTLSDVMASQQITTRLRGSDIEIAVRRTRINRLRSMR